MLIYCHKSCLTVVYLYDLIFLVAINVLTVFEEEIAKYCLAHSISIPNIKRLGTWVGHVDKDIEKQFFAKWMPRQIKEFLFCYYDSSEVFLIFSRYNRHKWLCALSHPMSPRSHSASRFTRLQLQMWGWVHADNQGEQECGKC